MRVVGILLCLLAVLTVAHAHTSQGGDYQCSYRGHAYADTPDECECYQCFYGNDCQKENATCVVDATGGNPGAFQQYWDLDDGKSSITIASNYRTEYDFEYYIPKDETTGLHGSLKAAISALHKSAGNANPDDKYIVLGYGCTLLLAAFQWASLQLAQQPMTTFAKAPYFSGYPNPSTYLKDLSFSSDQTLADSDVIELVTIPNNPDGEIRKALYNSSYTAYDMVYYWPSLVNISTLYDHDNMFFSLSKLSGHAGTRFGWGLVKSQEVAQLMGRYLEMVDQGMSTDVQYRALTIIKRLSEDGTDPSTGMFPFVKDIMSTRWTDLLSLFAKQSRFKQLSNPGTFYSWIYCNEEADQDNCAQPFIDLGISIVPGSEYGSTDAYCRLELVEYDPVWDIIMTRLKTLFTDEASQQ